MKTTREGRRFIVAAFLIMVAAFNTANNLIYLILSLMLSLLFLSALILRINLSGLRVDLSAEGPVFAGDESIINICVRNDKKIFPSFSVNVLSDDIGARSYYFKIKASQSGCNRVTARFNKRGFYDCRDLKIASGYPFILFYKEMPAYPGGNLLVYPAYHDIRGIDTAAYEREGWGGARTLGSGDDMLYIRQFRTGDDFRKIHWKALAKSSALMVREYAEFESSKITLLMDNSIPKDPDNFEKAVSITATLARDFIEKGYFVRVIASGRSVPFGSGYEHLLEILDMLAVVNEKEDDIMAPAEVEGEGFIVSVLKSSKVKGASALFSRGTQADLVIYADSL